MIESEIKLPILSKCFFPSPFWIFIQRTYKDEALRITKTIYLQDNIILTIVRKNYIILELVKKQCLSHRYSLPFKIFFQTLKIKIVNKAWLKVTVNDTVFKTADFIARRANVFKTLAKQKQLFKEVVLERLNTQEGFMYVPDL